MIKIFSKMKLNFTGCEVFPFETFDSDSERDPSFLKDVCCEKDSLLFILLHISLRIYWVCFYKLYQYQNRQAYACVHFPFFLRGRKQLTLSTFSFRPCTVSNQYSLYGNWSGQKSFLSPCSACFQSAFVQLPLKNSLLPWSRSLMNSKWKIFL